MKLSLVIFSLFIVGIYGADLELPTVTETTVIPEAKHKTTKPTTTTSTTSAPTTSSTTSSTTEATTTSSTTIEPSTTVPTTTSTTTTSTTTTTAAPKTTTVAPAPTPKPTPTPDPEVGNWTVSDGNQTCILVEFAIQLNVNYTTADKNVSTFIYNVPKTAQATGHCGNGTTDQNITLTWTDKTVSNEMSMTFKLNQTSHEFNLYKIVFGIDGAVLPGADNKTKFVFYHVGGVFNTHTDKSYHCTRVQELNVTATENEDKPNDVVGTVKFSKVLMEAFHKGDTKQYSEAVDCDAINTPDIVPIAVGIALIALVVIVLIAYFVGRSRSRSNGYVSM